MVKVKGPDPHNQKPLPRADLLREIPRLCPAFPPPLFPSSPHPLRPLCRLNIDRYINFFVLGFPVSSWTANSEQEVYVFRKRDSKSLYKGLNVRYRSHLHSPRDHTYTIIKARTIPLDFYWSTTPKAPAYFIMRVVFATCVACLEPFHLIGKPPSIAGVAIPGEMGE